MSETTEYGLRAANGYIRWCRDLNEARDMKSGRIINGRPGEWAHHEVVVRTRTVTFSDPRPVD